VQKLQVTVAGRKIWYNIFSVLKPKPGTGQIMNEFKIRRWTYCFSLTFGEDPA
jgi:hypothetical protein